MLKSCLFITLECLLSCITMVTICIYLTFFFKSVGINKVIITAASQGVFQHWLRAWTITCQHTHTLILETCTSLTRLSFTAPLLLLLLQQHCVSRERRHFKVLHKSDDARPDSKRSSAEKLFKTYQLIVADCCKFSFDVALHAKTTFGNSNQEVTQVARAQWFQATGRSLRTKTEFVTYPPKRKQIQTTAVCVKTKQNTQQRANAQ